MKSVRRLILGSLASMVFIIGDREHPGLDRPVFLPKPERDWEKRKKPRPRRRKRGKK